MAHSQETRRTVRNNYIRGMTLKTSAATAKVSYDTARNWKRKAEQDGDDWDVQRAAHNVSKSGVQAFTAEVIEDFVVMFKTTMDQVKEDKSIQPLAKAQIIAQLSDSYAKTVKSASDSTPKLSALAVAMDVIKLQAQFIRDNFPQMTEAFAEMLQPFGEEITKVFGS